MPQIKKRLQKSYRKQSIKLRIHRLNDHRNLLISNSSSMLSPLLPLVQHLLPPFSSPLEFSQVFSIKTVLDPSFNFACLPDSLCSHLLVGSSQMSRLLARTLELADLHGVYYTAAERQGGIFAENFYYSKYSHLVRGFSIRSNVLPFIIAAPDFLEICTPINDCDSGLMVVEVKSAESSMKLRKMKEGLNSLVNLQLQTEMAVFGLKRARLALVKVLDSTKRDYEVFSRCTISYDNFFESNHLDIIRAYIKCVLSKYLRRTFEITLRPTDTQKLIQFYYTNTIENFGKYKLTRLEELRERICPFDSREKKCIVEFKREFKNKYR